jgi:hypothetical protein
MRTAFSNSKDWVTLTIQFTCDLCDATWPVTHTFHRLGGGRRIEEERELRCHACYERMGPRQGMIVDGQGRAPEGSSTQARHGVRAS